MKATWAQNTAGTSDRRAFAQRVVLPPKIDGILNDPGWQGEPTVSGFTEYLPTYGRTEVPGSLTRVWICYDNSGIYIGAEMWDQSEKIQREFTRRDDTGNADWFSIYIDTYRDGLNGYEFGVTSAGVQFDKRYSSTNSRGDQSWDAVWSSAVQVERGRWTVEMKIPYSAIRFPDKPVQSWGFNIQRYRRETRQEMFWSPRRPDIDNFIFQWGVLEGIADVKAPLLLSLSPYASVAAEHYTETGWKEAFSVGADLKWGINQAFTLDASLIPDFGQVQSDPKVHNLTPFEVEYNEKRPFFMEGTELFNRGGYFYSRRIGGQPLYYNEVPLDQNEILTENPTESKLINALKFSGRTSGGLGIGVLNAISSRMYAEVEDTLTGIRRKYETSPLTNANVFVLDQSLRNNSYISVVNASVLRAGEAYDSDVLGLLFRLNDRNNRFYLQGQGTASLFSHKSAGFSYNLKAGKARGAWQYHVENVFLDDKIDINDLGVQRERNRMSLSGNLSYNHYTPGSWYSRYSFDITPSYTQRFMPWSYENAKIAFSSMLLLKDYSMLRLQGSYMFGSKDFYEPKKQGRFYRKPDGYSLSFYFSSNYNKPVYADIDLRYEEYLENKENMYEIRLKPGVRVSQRVSLVLTCGMSRMYRNIGYYRGNDVPSGQARDTVMFASRNRDIMENVIEGRFAFNNKMNISIAARHYVSKVQNSEFFFLQHDGHLSSVADDKGRPGEVYNLFYVDFLYTWRFAPGSELNFIWKNEISPQGSETLYESYFKDIRSLTNAPQRNILSLKLIYYIDWMTVFGK